MNNLIKVLLIGAVSCMAFSCNHQKDAASGNMDQAFAGYIQGRTTGVVSSNSSIVVILNQSVNGYENDEALPEGLFEFSPQIKGKASLLNGNKIEFYPDQALTNGKTYQVDFRLGKLITVDKAFEVYSFQFEVVPLDFTVLKGSLMVPEAESEEYEYKGRIRLSDPIALEELEKVFKLDDSRLNLTIDELGNNLLSYRINNIPRNEESWTFTLSWNSKPIGIDQKGELEVSVPGKNDFSLLSVEVEQGEDQHILLEFSDVLDPAQNLAGLIELQGTDQIRIRKNNHQVYIYPNDRLDGEWDLMVNQNIRSRHGKMLAEAETYHLALAPLPPKVEFLGTGYILPQTEGLYLPFRSVSLRAVDVYIYKIYDNNIQQFLQQNNPQESYNLRGSIKYVGRPILRKTIRLDEDPGINLSQWNSFSFDLAPLVQNDPNALYHVEIRLRKTLASFSCDGEPESDQAGLELLPEIFADNELVGYQDDQYYYEDLYPDEYDWMERDNPCDASYYTPDKFIYKTVVATNLGVTAKSGNQKDFLVAVTDLLTAQPVGNASIQFYNFQQQQILAGTTGSDGLASMSLPEVPYLLVVYSGDQRAYLRVDDGTSLSLSNFDVSGESVVSGIKGFIYGERGVWRPGDTLHLSFVLFDKNDVIPNDIPVVLEITDPRGQTSFKTVKTEGLDGFYKFTVPTSDDDPTGNWRALVKVGGAQFSKTLKIESIKPNRLKMNLEFNRKILVANDPRQLLDFSSQWLHGAQAAGLRAEISIKLTQGFSRFDGFREYNFSDPLREFWPYDMLVFDGLLDQAGLSKVPLDLNVNSSAPGMLNATFISRVFEKGGDFSTDVYTVPFSPYSRYVGVNIAGMDDEESPLATDTLHRVNVLTVDKDGKGISVNNLIARVYKIQWRWWWSSQSDNLAYYVGSENENLVYETGLSTQDGKGNFSFRVDYPDWGRYLVHVSDPNGGHAAGQIFYLDWPAWVNRSGRANPSGATMLTFTTNKKVYETGDMAAITFPSMKGGRALLTIESGSQVIESKWINTKATETLVRFEVTEEMAPNVYSSISLIQPHIHDGNDLPIRQYGVLRLPVTNPASTLEPKLKMPYEIRPESSYEVEVSEAKGRAMTYTLAIVDEGLLSLTRYKTPDPWQAFYATEALGVKTWDLYDGVLGAYGGRIEGLLAIGGDEGALQDGEKKANRFQSVVTFQGPFQLKKNKTDVHQVKMPNYVGEVRAMVIAGKGSAWGSTEAAAPVRQPLMVLTGLPRKLSPGEGLSLPVSIFVMKEGIKSVRVQVSTEGAVNCRAESMKEIQVSGIGEQMAYFDLQASESTGIATINVEVSSGNEKANNTTEIEVLNPNPYSYKTSSYLIENGEDAGFDVAFHGMKGTNSGSISISGLPSFDLEKNLQYLINYPYGCVEQTTSAAFVQLYLDNLLELDEILAGKTDKNIRDAIKRLSGFQLPGGGLSFWPGSSGVNLWGSSYAIHFLLMAEQEGYSIPYSMKDNLLKFQNSRASSYQGRSDYYGDSDLQQAYRLYTLALAGKANTSAMNRLRQKTDLDQPTAWRLAAAYALSGRKDVASDLISRYNRANLKSYSRPGPTFGSSLRDRAMILETLLLLERNEDAFKLAVEMAKDLKGHTWSTQSTAFGLMAMAQLADGQKSADKMLRFTLVINGKEEKVNTQKSVYNYSLAENDEGASVQVLSRNDGMLYVDYTTYGQAAPEESSASESGLEMHVQYHDLNGQEIDISRLSQGTTFLAEVWVHPTGVTGESDNMAISQIFPSGWEILSTRYAGQDDFGDESPYTYRDIRDDRVNTFFSLPDEVEVYYQVKLNAAYAGKYYLPPVACEDMYRPEIHSYSEGRWVEVEK